MKKALFALVLCVTSLVTLPALADVPNDDCGGKKAGDPCSNFMGDEGTCKEGTSGLVCDVSDPSASSGSAGGSGPASQSASGAGGSAAGAGGSGGSETEKSGEGASESDCSVRGIGTGAGLGATALLGAALAAGLARRPRGRRPR